MAFIDIVATAMPAAQGVASFDVVHYGYTKPLQDLLPPGRAFTRRAGAVLTKVLTAKGMERSRIQRCVRRFLRECDPATALDALESWEVLLGLPDCEVPTTIEARRIAAAEKLAATVGHTQDIGFWTDLFAKYGYKLELFDFGAWLLDCEDECDDPIVESFWLLVLWFLTSAGENDALLACRVEAERLLGLAISLHIAWEQVELDSSEGTLHSVASNSAGATVAVGAGGLALVSSGFLADWLEVDVGTSDTLYAVTAVADVLLAFGEAASCFRSIDNGETWTTVALASDEKYAAARGPDDDLVAIAAGENGRIYRTDDAGETWAEVTSPTTEQLYGAAAATGALVIVGAGGTILRSDDAGETWDEVTSPTTDPLRAVDGRGLVMIAAGIGGTVLRSANAGETWAIIDVDQTAALLGVAASKPGRWTICGEGGLILVSTDDGLTWTAQTTVLKEDFTAAAASVPFIFAVLVGTERTIALE